LIGPSLAEPFNARFASSPLECANLHSAQQKRPLTTSQPKQILSFVPLFDPLRIFLEDHVREGIDDLEAAQIVDGVVSLSA
jgi:hypothetical protein